MELKCGSRPRHSSFEDELIAGLMRIVSGKTVHTRRALPRRRFRRAIVRVIAARIINIEGACSGCLPRSRRLARARKCGRDGGDGRYVAGAYSRASAA